MSARRSFWTGRWWTWRSFTSTNGKNVTFSSVYRRRCERAHFCKSFCSPRGPGWFRGQVERVKCLERSQGVSRKSQDIVSNLFRTSLFFKCIRGTFFIADRQGSFKAILHTHTHTPFQNYSVFASMHVPNLLYIFKSLLFFQYKCFGTLLLLLLTNPQR